MRSSSAGALPCAALLLLLFSLAAMKAAAADTAGTPAGHTATQQLGAAAVAAALRANPPPDAAAFDSRSASTGDTSTSSRPLLDRFKVAADLRSQLEQMFAGEPDQLAKIQQAWSVEEQRGFKEETSELQFPGTGFGYHQSVTASSGSPEVQAMDVRDAINTLYEADHPQFQSRMEELVQGRGYPLERHPVVTSDGYELIMYRIPHGNYRNNKPGVAKPVVLLHHGITLASDSFVVLNANESLGFIFADAGFDVWMVNTRGNTYSRRNVKGLLPSEREFWYFSMDELALIDLPTQMDYVLQTTGAKKMAFVGHSQGCTLAYLLCAGKPEYNDKFSVIGHMGPVFFVDFFRAPVLRAIATASLDQLLYILDIAEFIPNRLTAPLAGILCTSWPLSDVCAAAVSLIFYGPSIFITPDDYTLIARTWPSSVGSRNLVHWAQNFRSPELELRQYDFGTACNLTHWRPGRGFHPKPYFETCNQAKYGALIPPAYDLTKVTAPNVFFLGENDIVTAASDASEQQKRITTANKAQFEYADYAHMDFVWDRNSKHSVDMVDTFFRFAPGTF